MLVFMLLNIFDDLLVYFKVDFNQCVIYFITTVIQLTIIKDLIDLLID